ncbi:unnamed protein product [Prunus armeniaca]|uniref:Uncharacterized protein n=1 Tax=Prunus armeniaca TaxID=36596 RepID=A0A6J5WF87_PRUAR|nr:unnamed protein product [Prunus armeniaca]
MEIQGKIRATASEMPAKDALMQTAKWGKKKSNAGIQDHEWGETRGIDGGHRGISNVWAHQVLGRGAKLAHHKGADL